MNIDAVRELCLSLPAATEKISWGCDLTFRVHEKIFAVAVLGPAHVWLSFKCSPETFAELTERVGVIPAPYMARAKWVALETKDALPDAELTNLLRNSYELVFAKLPKKTQWAISQHEQGKKQARAKPHSHNAVEKRRSKKEGTRSI